MAKGMIAHGTTGVAAVFDFDPAAAAKATVAPW
ncbi:hypothetical protein FHS38_006312 [Streptomyces netropsis]|uniref:Uncharacterized protein n=1 Tax=Streptomyces netropsis TaxID=55404 RepID=A0A7W7LHP2_STRNE|nr:hypothetical protein [Streptomyces netropsis]